MRGRRCVFRCADVWGVLACTLAVCAQLCVLACALMYVCVSVGHGCVWLRVRLCVIMRWLYVYLCVSVRCSVFVHGYTVVFVSACACVCVLVCVSVCVCGCVCRYVARFTEPLTKDGNLECHLACKVASHK